jgi:dihydrofolate synthase/folylpolyglutamate synthase
LSDSGSARAYLLSLEQIGIKLGLEQIRALVLNLGQPDRAYPSLLVAGTNGKGSVTAMVERGLRAAGYRTGRYTSPHLVQLEERFVVNGRPIAPDALEAAAETVRAAARSLPAPPSFFEATTALALQVFREVHVDVAVLEVGLGGRLDATNAVTPLGVAITSIDFDHEQYLGYTLDAIAHEKAGIIKPDTFAVLSENPSVVREIVQQTCARQGASFIFAPDGVAVDATMIDGRARLSFETPHARYEAVTLGLRGRHQVDNAVTAVRLLETLAARGAFALDAAAIRRALSDVEWPGRLELLPWRGREVLLDGAHNPAAARALAAYLRETYGSPVPMVIGAMRDKQLEALVGAFAGAASQFVFTAAATPRAASAAELIAVARRVAPAIEATERARPMDALALACAAGAPVVVAGSLFLVGEIRAEIS